MLVSTNPDKEHSSIESCLSEPNYIRTYPSCLLLVLQIRSTSTPHHQHQPTYAELTRTAQLPSYCTIDRSRLRRRTSDQDAQSQAQQQKPPKPPTPRKPPRRTPSLNAAKAAGLVPSRPSQRSKSVEVLDRDPEQPRNTVAVDSDLFVSTTYIGDCGIDELRRVSSEYVLDRKLPQQQQQQLLHPGAGGTIGPAKSVKIHPNVTEFHYPGKHGYTAEYGILFQG